MSYNTEKQLISDNMMLGLSILDAHLSGNQDMLQTISTTYSCDEREVALSIALSYALGSLQAVGGFEDQESVIAHLRQNACSVTTD